MKKGELDNAMIMALDMTVSVMGSAMLTWGGFWEGFSGAKLAGATLTTACLIFSGLRDTQHLIRKVCGYYEKPRRERKKINSVQGTPWTEVRFNGYVPVDGNPAHDDKAV